MTKTNMGPRSIVSDNSVFANETLVVKLSDLTWTSDRSEDAEQSALDGGESFQSLCDSIENTAKVNKAAYGNDRPVEVYTKKGSEGLFVAAGRRRCNASKKVGLDSVLAIYKGELSEKDALVLGTVENVTRKGLTYVEKVKRFGTLAKEHKMSKEQINALTGIPVKTLGNLLRIANKFAPESFDFAEKNKVSSETILAAAGKDGAEKQIAYMQEALDKLAGKKAEKSEKEPKEEKEEKGEAPEGEDTSRLEERVKAALARLPLGRAADRVLAQAMLCLSEQSVTLIEVMADAMGDGAPASKPAAQAEPTATN